MVLGFLETLINYLVDMIVHISHFSLTLWKVNAVSFEHLLYSEVNRLVFLKFHIDGHIFLNAVVKDELSQLFRMLEIVVRANKGTFKSK